MYCSSRARVNRRSREPKSYYCFSTPLALRSKNINYAILCLTMHISFITTVYNEHITIDQFLNTILSQTKLPKEIIITDAGSTDKTLQKIKQFQKNTTVPITLIHKEGNRSIGRNQAIKRAKGEIIACSDAGCILDKNWLKNITKPFKDKKIDVVSGYYTPKTKTTFEQALSTYTCVMPDKVDPNNFLPSSRSIAFKKQAWKTVGGYPENLDTCEDLIFAQNLKKRGYKFIFAKNAIVHWPQRKNLLQSWKQFYSYALGDGQARFIRKQTPFLYLRYLLGTILAIIAIITKNNFLFSIISSMFILYLIWSIQKNYKYVRNKKAFFYLPLLQLTADSAVILGTTIGLFSTRIKH